jgi:hypothetical protein
MPQIRARVNVENYVPRITERVRVLARDAAEEGAKAGARAAAEIAAQRSVSGQMAAIRAEPAIPAERSGWVAFIVSPTYYAWFQNFGTLGNRARSLKRAPTTKRTRQPGTGIKPLRFLDAGRRVARKAALERLKGGL